MRQRASIASNRLVPFSLSIHRSPGEQWKGGARRRQSEQRNYGREPASISPRSPGT